MKLIAAILLSIFSLVQVAPAFQSLIKESKGYIFNIDEEKGAEKSSVEKKATQRDITTPYASGNLLNMASNSPYDRQEKLHLSPFLEKSTPPPNC